MQTPQSPHSVHEVYAGYEHDWWLHEPVSLLAPSSLDRERVPGPHVEEQGPHAAQEDKDPEVEAKGMARRSRNKRPKVIGMVRCFSILEQGQNSPPSACMVLRITPGVID